MVSIANMIINFIFRPDFRQTFFHYTNAAGMCVCPLQIDLNFYLENTWQRRNVHAHPSHHFLPSFNSNSAESAINQIVRIIYLKQQAYFLHRCKWECYNLFPTSTENKTKKIYLISAIKFKSNLLSENFNIEDTDERACEYHQAYWLKLMICVQLFIYPTIQSI